jgi:hypothetical protein
VLRDHESLPSSCSLTERLCVRHSSSQKTALIRTNLSLSRAGRARGPCDTDGTSRLLSREVPMAESIYKTPEGEAEIRALYDEALAGLAVGHDSVTVGTRLGETHVLALGPEGAPPVVFLPGGNALNPTCLKWFLPLTERHRLYAPDIVGQPGLSAQSRPSPKGDGHAFWAEDVLDGLALEPSLGACAARGPLLRGGRSHQDHGSSPERVSPAGIAASPFLRMLLEIGPPTLLYRLRPTKERLERDPQAPPSGSSGPPSGTSGWTPTSPGRHRGGARGLRWSGGCVRLRA